MSVLCRRLEVRPDEVRARALLAKLDKVQDELNQLSGTTNDTSTALGRKNKNRKSLLYSQRNKYRREVEAIIHRLNIEKVLNYGTLLH